MKPTEVGQLIDESAQRDAIHIAVAPVIAYERLEPGEHVGFCDGSTKEVCSSGEPIGIVDPFLRKTVNAGQRFWLFLYPQTITSLRHNWTHPAFATETQTDPQMNASEAWLRAFAEDSGLGYAAMLDAARQWIEYEDYLNLGPLLEGKYVPDEFWPHYEKATGRSVAEGKRQNFFTCSC